MKRLLAVLTLTLISAGAALVVGEVALRARGYSSPIFYEPDENLGWRLRPGARGWFQEEGKGFVLVSPAGFRDRSHDLAKPKGTYRVAVLGDSFAEAKQVEFKSTFGWQ